MTIEQLDALHRARPFRPFTISLGDGRSFRVRHPEFLARTPGGRTVILGLEEESHEVIDLLLVRSLSTANGAQRRRRTRKR
jgi:hypothetical protein